MTITEATAWRDYGAARRETARVEAAQAAASASRERFQQRVAEGQAQLSTEPTLKTRRLLDIKV